MYYAPYLLTHKNEVKYASLQVFQVSECILSSLKNYFSKCLNVKDEAIYLKHTSSKFNKINFANTVIRLPTGKHPTKPLHI